MWTWFSNFFENALVGAPADIEAGPRRAGLFLSRTTGIRLEWDTSNRALAFPDFHYPAGVWLGCPVHQVSYYSVAEGDRGSIVDKIHSAQVFGVFGIPNYEVVASHLLPRAQRPAGS